MVSIVSANTENIGGKAFGQMVLELPSDKEEQRRIIDYLDGRGIHYETASNLLPEETSGNEGDGKVADAGTFFEENLEDLTEDVRKRGDL